MASEEYENLLFMRNSMTTVVETRPDGSEVVLKTCRVSMTADERLKRLYPMVDEDETPLPRSWNSKDKFTNLGLSQNNMRVHYKGTDATGYASLFPWTAAAVRDKSKSLCRRSHFGVRASG